MMNNFFKMHLFWLALLSVVSTSFLYKKEQVKDSKAQVKIIFINKAGNRKIVLDDSSYTNSFNEPYTITKLKYYITDVQLKGSSNRYKEENSYHLIDENDSASKVINLSVTSGKYSNLIFLLGVDSLHNVSGAQADALDPANDMFWTWNSGYVMAKMEGTSPASSLVNYKVEYHIGGFSGPYNVLKTIQLSFPGNPVQFSAGKACTIIVNADINTWWHGASDIKIAAHPAITTPGIIAKSISDNYAHMFHIEKIIAE